MPFKTAPPALCLVLATLLSTTATAQDEGPAPPLWEAGLFGLASAQPAYPGSALRTRRGIVLPFLIYRGRFLRAEQGGVGLRAVKTPFVEVDVGFAAAFGAPSSESAVRRGLPDIGTLVEFGPRVKLNLGQGFRAELPLRGVFDVNDRFTHRGMSFEPQIGWGTRSDSGWNFGLNASVVLGDARLASTFYGVAPEYATATRPAYSARSGLITTRLGANASTRLSPDWRAFGFVRLDSVSAAANESSPLVERRGGASFGVGLSWTFARSARTAAD